MFVLVRYESYDGGEDHEDSMSCSLVGVYRAVGDARRAMESQHNDRMAVDRADARRWNERSSDGWREVEGFVHDRSAMVNVSGSSYCTEWFILDSDQPGRVGHGFSDLDY